MLDGYSLQHREPRAETIYTYVQHCAVHNSESVALLAAGRPPLTYAQLSTQIDVVGKELRLANIGTSDRVAVVLPASVEAAVATLAIAVHANCAPLNPAYSAREFEFYLSSLHARALLVLHGSSSPAIAAAKSLNIRILFLLPDTKSPAGIFSFLPDSGTDPVDAKWSAASGPALLLFTSGTTARPKLVPLSHRQLCLSAESICSALELEPSDRCFGLMPLYHIHGLSTLFATLASGGSYISTAGFSPESFFTGLEEFCPTWYSASPAFHRAILDGAQSRRGQRANSSLRFIRAASAPMPKQLIAEIETTFGVPLIEAYGMTEAAPQIASNRLPPFERRPGSVGKAAGPEVAIMDEAGRLLGVGATGEVVIRGPNVIKHYDGESGEDKEAFFGSWFRTGDLGRLDIDGYLCITGRLREIINRGGEKIAPAWVEEVLLEHPAVAEAAVFSVPHAVLGATVGAAIVLVPGMHSTARQIRNFVAARLARFEVPQQVVFVDQIPLGPAAKRSRRGLADALGLVGSGQHQAAVIGKTAPRTAAQKRVADIFAEVLRTETPEIHADFFELGGDSLVAMQVVARLRQTFQTTLPIDVLFANPTVAGIAERIGEQMANLVAEGAARLESKPLLPRDANHEEMRIVRRHDTAPAPLTFGQQGIYFLDQMGSATAYNMSASLWLAGQVDERALSRALQEICARHEILRTHFPMRGDHPVQMVSPLQPEASLTVIDLSARPVPERAAEAKRLATQDACQRFDLETGPLFRAKLVRIGPEESLLLMGMHHIVSDAWSIGVLYKELKQLYEAFRNGRTSPLADLPLQYADVATWEQLRLGDGQFDRDAAYLAGQLVNSPPECTFPTDRPRPAIQSYRGAIEQLLIDRHLTDRLKSLASSENVTLFMTLLAAFKTLLFRHNGQDDCVVGVPTANRPRRELESLIGFFANTLVLRSSLAGDPSFVELLARVRATSLDAFAHQDIPLERILSDLRVPRDVSRTPLFQVMFAFQNVPTAAGPSTFAETSTMRSFDFAPDLVARPFPVDNGTAKFDLTLYLSEVDEGMSLTWQFNRDLFELTTIRRIVRQFQTLLEGIAENPRQTLSELPLLSSDDKRQLEVDWNNTQAAQAFDQSFVELFEAQVERAPNALAVMGREIQLTYRELNECANRFARYFQRLGVGHNSLVGVCLPRAPETLAVLLGIWKACGAFLPLDPDYPIERIAFMLREAGVSLLVTQTSFVPNLAAAVPSSTTDLPEIVRLDAYQAKISGESTGNLEATPAAGALAYVIYTSGSTGKPKGVMITHGNVCHYAQALTQAIGIQSDDRYLHSASFSFSASVRQFVVPLSCGAAVIIASTGEIRDPQRLFETIRDRATTIVDLVPSFSATCLDILPSLEPSLRAGLLDNHVRLMLSASEPLPSALVEGWRQLCRPATTFFNMFGQTETTGIVMTYQLPVGGETGAIVPVGKPIANTQAYVLDGSRHLVPVGICGELHMGGAGIGLGYIHRPEQTAASFVPNPFGGQIGKQLYRTGDLARYRSDGVIELVGRADAQIKIRGFRVEPGEVEAAIRTHPGVRECLVTAANDDIEPDRIGHESLVAFVATEDQHPGELASIASKLRVFLMQKLPEYMVPQRIVRLATLPRTPSGKLDRQALLATLTPSASWAPVRPQRSTPAEPPQTGTQDIQRILTEIWKKVLRLDRVAPGDNFFDLGGNSRLSMNVLFEAKRAGLNITLSQLYQHQTIAELARVAVESIPVTSQSPMIADPSSGPPSGPLLTIASLRAFGREVLLRAGLHSDGAEIVTEVQLEASLRGQPTHDMVSIPRYATRIATGKINPRPRIQIERETPNTAQVDGDNGPGQWISMVAIGIAMRKAREQGIGIVSARRSNHFGAAGHYVWEAAKTGLIGLCTTNGPAILAPTGGVTPTFGNNPLAIGIPAGRHFPILLDIAMSVAPRGRIGQTVAEGKPLPLGWILDRIGQPSTDLADLAAGLGVPIGGHKGYGLALALEALAGVMSGSGFGADHRPDALRSRSEPDDYGHLFVAIDPERFMPAPEFAARIDRLIEQTKSGERAPNVEEIWIPGERELRTRDRSLTEGVRLRFSTYRALVSYGQEKGITAKLVLQGDTAV